MDVAMRCSSIELKEHEKFMGRNKRKFVKEKSQFVKGGITDFVFI